MFFFEENFQELRSLGVKTLLSIAAGILATGRVAACAA